MIMKPRFKVGDLIAIKTTANIRSEERRNDYGRVYLLVAYHLGRSVENPDGKYTMPYYDVLIGDVVARRGLKFINRNCELLEWFNV